MPPSTQLQPKHHVGLWIEHRRIAGWVLLLGPGVLGLLWLAAGLLIRDVPVLQIVALPPLLTAALLLGVRARLGRRIRAAEQGQAPPAGRRRLAFGMGLMGAVATGALFKFGPSVAAAARLGGERLPWLTHTLLGSVVLFGALVLALCARFYGTTDREVLVEARGLAVWLRSCAWTSLLAGLYFLSPAVYGSSTDLLHTLAHGAGALVVALALLELCLRGLSRRPTRVDPAADLFLLSLIASRWNPLSSFFGTLTDAFGIDLRGTWSLRFIQRSLAPLGLGLVALAWIGSAFTLVDTSEVGLLETFGAAAEGEPLGPGLAVHWPFPIQSVHRVDTGRVRTLPIGFVGADEDASLLWTKRHAEEEYSLLLGNGQDLVTVNAILHYRIADPRAYLYGTEDADAVLAALADRALMGETVGGSLDRVLSENVGQLSSQVERAVQASVDELGLGLEVLDLTLIGLHPPMVVARDYQAVVGAQIEEETLVHQAQADEALALPGAHADARRTVGVATASSSLRTAAARGEAAAFEAQAEASAAAPELFRFRRLLEARERQLAGKAFVVIDERFEQQGAVINALGSEDTGSPVTEDQTP